MDWITFWATVGPLVGAALGTVASFGTVWIQQRAESRRARARLASEMALQQYLAEVGDLKDASRRAIIPPLVAWQHLHLRILEEMEAGKLDETAIRNIWIENGEIEKTLAFMGKIDLKPKAAK